MMKKAIMVNYINYVYQNDQVTEYKISTKGEFELNDGVNIVSFRDTNNQHISLELMYSSKSVILKKIEHDKVSKLVFSLNKDITNQYLTNYGNLAIVSRVIDYLYKDDEMVLEYYLLMQNEIQGRYKIVLRIKECYDERKQH
jgi:uncharacterized beta-barrel protein YwiB (DUF1934 family)